MKTLTMITCLVISTGAFAAWTSPAGMTPVKQEIVKSEVRDPASVKTEEKKVPHGQKNSDD